MESSVAQLVMTARNGDSEAFCQLIRIYEKPALSTAYGVLADAALAGDVVQEVFLQAWSQLSTLREADRFGPWVLQMTRNRAIDQTRRRNLASLEHGSDLASAINQPDDDLESAELRQQIGSALRQLDDITREAVSMRYFENLSSKDIAIRLELSPAAVDMRLSRARQQLREILSDMAVNER